MVLAPAAAFPTHSASTLVFDDHTTATYHSIPSTTSASPLSALYIVTLPIALVWNGVLALTRAFRHSDSTTSTTARRPHPLLTFVRTILLCVALALVVQVAYLHFMFDYAPPGYWTETIRALNSNDWYGYLDDLRVPRVLDEDFQRNADILVQNRVNMRGARVGTLQG